MLKRTKYLAFVLTILLITIFIACMEENPVVPDTTAPMVQITNPASGSVITEPINIQIAGSDNVGISTIIVILDGDTLSILSASPYSVFWNVGYWADGQNHTLLAVASDEAGNTSQSDLVNVVISTDAQISPNLLSPSNNAVFSENENITFAWNKIIDAVSYELHVSTDTTFSNLIITENMTDTNYTNNSLNPGTYFWRVRSQNTNNQFSAWSNYFSFAKGNLKWKITLDRGLSDWGNHIAETNDGGYIVVGPSYTDTTNMFQDIWLNKLDFSGNKVWENIFGDPAADYGNWVEQATDGGFYIFGGHSENSRQMWLIRTDEHGNKLWDKKYGNPDSSSWGIKGIIGENDNIFVCGTYENRCCILNIDAIGNLIWEKQLDFDSTTTSVGDIDLCSDGSIVGLTRKYVFKLDNLGVIQWYKEIQLLESERLRRIIQITDDEFVIVVYDYQNESGKILKINEFGNEVWRYENNSMFYGIVEKSGEGVVACGTSSSGNIFVMARDYDNNLLWTREYSYGIGINIITTSSGGFLVTGSTSRWGLDDSDIFVMKTDSEGNTEGGLGTANFIERLFRSNAKSLNNPFGAIR